MSGRTQTQQLACVGSHTRTHACACAVTQMHAHTHKHTKHSHERARLHIMGIDTHTHVFAYVLSLSLTLSLIHTHTHTLISIKKKHTHTQACVYIHLVMSYRGRVGEGGEQQRERERERESLRSMTVVLVGNCIKERRKLAYRKEQQQKNPLPKAFSALLKHLGCKKLSYNNILLRRNKIFFPRIWLTSAIREHRPQESILPLATQVVRRYICGTSFTFGKAAPPHGSPSLAPFLWHSCTEKAEPYLWLRNWSSSGYPARRPTL